MRYDGTQWHNITRKAIESELAKGQKALDFMNVAVDPNNKHHYYVTSYGTGLYEFDHDTLVHHYLPGDDNTLIAVIESAPKTYTRLDWATYDDQGNLWIMDAGVQYALQCLDTTGTWHSIPLVFNSAFFPLHTPGALIFDSKNPNYKWTCAARYNTGVCLLDDNGTPFDISDDRFIYRAQSTNQVGQTFHTRLSPTTKKVSPAKSASVSGSRCPQTKR